MSARRAWLGAAVLCVVLSAANGALAWDPLQSANSNVAEGNRRMAAGKAKTALEAYDRAARELPSSPGVQLDRGLALMATGKLDDAREAFLRATEPPAPAPIRADAYYDLGLAFYRQGDASAKKQSHDEAQRLFREAADAFKQSLRAKPGNRDAGWNLELALRRIREQKEEQRQEEQKKKEEQKKQKQDQQNQQQNQDQQNQDQQNQDQQNQDQQNQDQGQQQQQNQKKQEPQGQQPQNGKQGKEKQPTPPGQADEAKPLPKDARRVLDALESSEDNLWRHEARMRGQAERRQPVKDW